MLNSHMPTPSSLPTPAFEREASHPHTKLVGSAYRHLIRMGIFTSLTAADL